MMRKLLFTVTILSILIYVGVLIISALDKRDLTKISLVTYPSEVAISINGSLETSQKDYYLESGTYTATVSREGFSTEHIQIDTERDGSYPLLASLTPVSEAANKWVEENPDEYESFENLSSQILSQRGADLREQYPIVQYLPAKSSLYSIGYVSNQDGSITVTVHAPDVYVPYAINHIEKWGIDPEDYAIDFVNQRNVFKDE